MRIVSLAPSNTEILFGLGLSDEIVAVTSLCDYPSQTRSKIKIGSWIHTEPERIARLEPDLIFTSYFLPESLKNWGGPGQIIHVKPKTLQDVYKSILTIGKAVGKVKNAEKMVNTMKAKFDTIYKNRARTMKKVFMEEWPVPPFVSGNWVPELVEIAGGVPVIAKKGKPSIEFSFQELQTTDPDIMIFHWCGYGKAFKKALVTSRSKWQSLSAVKNDMMFVIDDSLLNRPSPRLVDGARKIQELLLQ